MSKKISMSQSWEKIMIPRELLYRLMTNMVVFPAVRVNNLNDQDLLNKKVLTCLINALMQTGVSITDSLGNDVQHATTLITEIDTCIKQGNEEAESNERFERGIK
jgi:hypothetical protein